MQLDSLCLPPVDERAIAIEVCLWDNISYLEMSLHTQRVRAIEELWVFVLRCIRLDGRTRCRTLTE